MVTRMVKRISRRQHETFATNSSHSVCFLLRQYSSPRKYHPFQRDRRGRDALPSGPRLSPVRAPPPALLILLALRSALLLHGRRLRALAASRRRLLLHRWRLPATVVVHALSSGRRLRHSRHVRPLRRRDCRYAPEPVVPAPCGTGTRQQTGSGTVTGLLLLSPTSVACTPPTISVQPAHDFTYPLISFSLIPCTHPDINPSFVL